MKTCSSILMLLSLLASCSGKDAFVDAERQVVLDDKKAVYDPNNEIQLWHPSAEDTDKALSRIYKHLLAKRKGNSDIESIIENKREYGVQFVGIVRNKKKYIYCNFFNFNDDFKYWRQSIVFVLDGGNRFWNIEYNVDEDRCESLWINGMG